MCESIRPILTEAAWHQISVNTQRVVKRSRSMAVFREYLSPQFEVYHKSDLNDNLRRFFASIRYKLGINVKTSTLNSFKYGI